MSAKLTIHGLAEFQQALREMPEHLAAEAQTIVIAAAENAKQEITEAYPTRVGGELRSHMRVRHQAVGPLHTRSIVDNTSHLANWFEFGTQARHTRLGANRGSMPPGHVFVPIAAAARRRMEATLIELILREGFVVR